MGAKAKPDLQLGGSLMHERKPDFSGYVTRSGVKCSDGRTILKDAFKHQDKTTVPLVWQHGHDDPENVLGHTVLENRDDGVYGYGFFNDTPAAKHMKTAVEHEDIKFLSIYANQLKEKALSVLHGMIREVSLVMAGANPGAFIDNVAVRHSDGSLVNLDDEVIIYSGRELIHGDQPEEKKPPEEQKKDGEGDGPTVKDVYDAMTDDQKAVVHYMVGAAIEADGTAEHSDKSNDKKKEGTWMSRNVFEEQAKKKDGPERRALSHDDLKGIMADALERKSLKGAVEAYALKHGIENIEVLFPDARSVEATPDFDKRRTEWVAGVINGTKHSPFSRIKSLVADITFDEARAKGYIKGEFKKEEWFSVAKRVTTPATVYKKQKLDRDDIIDIVDFDVVAWMKGEMRLMLDEEIARAVLVGDGRAVDDEDKVKDPAGLPEGAGIRSILNDHDLYAATITVPAGAEPTAMVDALTAAMRFYKGSGSPTMYTTQIRLTTMLLARDGDGHRMYRNASELATEIGVSSIVPVEVMEDEAYEDVVGIVVNLKDYTIGADKGGDVSFFDDFDIDYNQFKYLLETRISGGLTKIRSALVLKEADAGQNAVTPEKPDFDGTTVTVKTTTGVTYRDKSDGSPLTTASPVTLAPGESLTVEAVPTSASTTYFPNNVEDQWTFKNTSGS